MSVLSKLTSAVVQASKSTAVVVEKGAVGTAHGVAAVFGSMFDTANQIAKSQNTNGVANGTLNNNDIGLLFLKVGNIPPGVTNVSQVSAAATLLNDNGASLPTSADLSGNPVYGNGTNDAAMQAAVISFLGKQVPPIKSDGSLNSDFWHAAMHVPLNVGLINPNPNCYPGTDLGPTLLVAKGMIANGGLATSTAAATGTSNTTTNTGSTTVANGATTGQQPGTFVPNGNTTAATDTTLSAPAPITNINDPRVIQEAQTVTNGTAVPNLDNGVAGYLMQLSNLLPSATILADETAVGFNSGNASKYTLAVNSGNGAQSQLDITSQIKGVTASNAGSTAQNVVQQYAFAYLMGLQAQGTQINMDGSMQQASTAASTSTSSASGTAASNALTLASLTGSLNISG